MKKLLYVLPVALSLAFISTAPSASAKDMPQAPQHDWSSMEKNKHNPEKMMEKQTREINEDYNEAIEKIGKSSFSNDQKDLLAAQAKENKDLAMKQLKEKTDLLSKHMEARKGMKDSIMAEKANRKAVKEVKKILMDD